MLGVPCASKICSLPRLKKLQMDSLLQNRAQRITSKTKLYELCGNPDALTRGLRECLDVLDLCASRGISVTGMLIR